MQEQGNPFKRHPTRYRGIVYRETDAGRTYYVYSGGKYQKVVGGEAEARDLKRKLDAPGRPTRAPRRSRFEPVAREWLIVKRQKCRAWTLKGYQEALDNILVPRFGKHWLNEISTQEVADLIRELSGRGLSLSTIRNYLKPLNGVLGYAVRRGLLNVNPYDALTSDDWPKAPERRTYEWSDAEIDALLDAASELGTRKTARQDYFPILFAAVNTGLRLGELLGLRWEDLETPDEGPAVLHVRKQLTRDGELEEPKTAKGRRRVPLTDDVAAFFKARRFAASYPGDGFPVFAAAHGKPLSHRNVQRRGFDPARELARERLGKGFTHADDKPVTFHDLRHAFASRAASRGVPVGVLSAILGQANVGITQTVYVHLYGRDEAEKQYREAMSVGK
jgi:integrase